MDEKLAALTQIYQVLENTLDGHLLACHRGCAACCTLNVTMTTLEAYQIINYLNQTEGMDLLDRLSASSAKSRFIPELTINALARRCVGSAEIPEEQHTLGRGVCPLLIDNTCAVYAARPLACRTMVSSRDCHMTGYATMNPFILSVNRSKGKNIMQIYVSGSLAYDRIMDFPGKFEDHILPDKIHVLNVCFTVNGLAEKFGGTAGNIAYSLSLLGETPLILATAGSDFERYEKWLRRHQLSTTGIRKVNDTLTAGAYITTDQSDNQITGFNPGAMQHPSNYGFEKIDADNAFAIVAPGNLDDMQHYSRHYQKIGVDYIFDPGQSIPALTGEALTDMITGCKYLISNDYELELIKKATGMQNGDLLKRCEAVITTLGENGSVVRTAQNEIPVGSAAVDNVVDPTGAGDAFRAGLIKGIIANKTLVDAARMGTVSASYAVENQGTQAHSFTLDEFDTRYRRTFG